jgi:uncharacterized membrane protein
VITDNEVFLLFERKLAGTILLEAHGDSLDKQVAVAVRTSLKSVRRELMELIKHEQSYSQNAEEVAPEYQVRHHNGLRLAVGCLEPDS